MRAGLSVSRVSVPVKPPSPKAPLARNGDQLGQPAAIQPTASIPKVDSDVEGCDLVMHTRTLIKPDTNASIDTSKHHAMWPPPHLPCDGSDEAVCILKQ